MSNEVMVSRAKKLVDDGDVEYVNTNGNTLNFQGRGHNVSKAEVYLITAEIQHNGEIEWTCSCRWNEYHDDCKHTIACGSNNDSWSLLIKKELTIKYNDRIDVLSADKDSDVIHVPEVVVGKIHIESDDD
jgi:hypothetical protein